MKGFDNWLDNYGNPNPGDESPDCFAPLPEYPCIYPRCGVNCYWLRAEE
jgi:hypothetical protein